MLLYALLLCLISWTVDARSDYTSYIQPYTYTSWGYWGHINWCPRGTYAYAFRLKVEGSQGRGDDTALNGILLYCRGKHMGHSYTISSSVGPWGHWRTTHFCPHHYFFSGASAKSEWRQGRGDDTAVNNYYFLCKSRKYSAHYYALNGDGMRWGRKTSRRDCPSGSYICGVQTQVEPPQGRGDDTALNDARFYCCRG